MTDFPTPAEHIAVTFRGTRSGSAGLTWAQREIWESFEAGSPPRSYFNLTRLLAVPANRTTADVLAVVRELAQRYEALRTTVIRGPDDEPLQCVSDHGEYSVARYETAGQDSAAVAEEVLAHYSGHPFIDEEWPLRIAVVTRAGRPMYLVLLASHLAVDRTAMDRVCGVCERLLAGESLPPESSRHPLDQAVVENSPHGRRTADRAIAYWRRTLEVVPQTMFPVLAGPAEAPWPRAWMRSAAAAAAAAELANRHRTSISGTVLAATAALLGACSGTGTVVLRLLVGNRFAPDVRDMVGTRAQFALCVIDTADTSFADFLGRTWSAAVKAYRHAQYPHGPVRTAISEINTARGIVLDLDCYFHYFAAGLDRSWSNLSVSRECLVAASERTEFRSTNAWPNFRRVSVNAHASRSALLLSLSSDPTKLSRADVEAMVRGVETLLVRAVHEDFAISDVPALTGIARPSG